MARVCLMATHAYLPSSGFNQELPSCRVSKEFHSFCPSLGASIGSRTLNLSAIHPKEPWEPMNEFLKDVQGPYPNSVLLSFGIAEHCTKHEKFMHFLRSEFSEEEKSKLDASQLTEWLNLHNMTIDAPQQKYCSTKSGSFFHALSSKTSLVFPHNKLFSQKPLLEYSGSLASNSKAADGQGLLINPVEMKEILSMVQNAYLPKYPTTQKLPLLIPYYNRTTKRKADSPKRTHAAVEVGPSKSLGKVKFKSLQTKKNSREAGRERDLYRKNSFHACESLLSLLMDSRQQSKTACATVRRSGPELPQLLTRFSSGIAGTGLAVLFSIVCKIACGRVPISAPRLFNAGIGFGLVWLSGAVHGLRDTVVSICRSSGKLGLEEEEAAKRVHRNVNEIFFRAAAVSAVLVLRLA